MIITLCGSTKFKAEFEAKNKELTLAGNIVISVACFGHSGDRFTDEQKTLLDEIHKRKIDLSDAIYVINKGGYIGESTRGEIEYAKAHGKRIMFMEADSSLIGDSVNGDKIVFYDGIITIICDDATEGNTPRAKKLYPTALGSPYAKGVSLNDCLKIIEFDGEGTVMVIYEEPLKGEVYEYGNYRPECWIKHGTTQGYA